MIKHGKVGVFTFAEVEVSQPELLRAEIVPKPVTCFGGNDGDAEAGNASGGTGPYSYTWSNSGTGQTISTLTAGTYTVTAQDANV